VENCGGIIGKQSKHRDRGAKRMSSYIEIRRQIEALSADEQLRLLEDLASIVRQRATTQPKRSILELKGLGKEIWQDIEAQEYVNQERDSWTG
jgi:hypothetical protein